MKIPKLLERVLAIVFILITIALVVNAQAPPPSTNPPGAPIDGMVGLLIAAGVGYGIKRSREQK
jgi:hypothetical protein